MVPITAAGPRGISYPGGLELQATTNAAVGALGPHRVRGFSGNNGFSRDSGRQGAGSQGKVIAPSEQGAQL
jgi:hypothetical protein